MLSMHPDYWRDHQLCVDSASVLIRWQQTGKWPLANMSPNELRAYHKAKFEKCLEYSEALNKEGNACQV